jgi:uncharacterized membrane protein
MGEEIGEQCMAELFGALTQLGRKPVRSAGSGEPSLECSVQGRVGRSHLLKLARTEHPVLTAARTSHTFGSLPLRRLEDPMSAPSPVPPPVPATGTGLTPNLAGALAYLLGPITGIIFLIVEKTNTFVRFHAMQSTVLWVGWVIASIALSILSGVVPVIGWIFGLVLSIVMSFGGFILWLVLMWKAYQGQEWELPIVGPFARKQVSASTSV